MIVALCAACLGASSDQQLSVEVSRSVPVADVTVMDVYRPTEGVDLPMLVLLHGTGEGGTAEMEPLARAIAERGVVVFVPSWPVIEERPVWASFDPQIYRLQTEAVVCSLRHARRAAVDYGGSPDRLALMGHSGGALVGLRAALVDDPPWTGMECDEEVDHRPAVFIGTGGDYGGRYQFTAAAGDRYDPFDPELLMGGNTGLVVELLHGFRDVNVDSRHSARLHEQLVMAGYDAELTGLDTRHGALIRPSEAAGRFVVDRVTRLLDPGGDDDVELRATLAFDGTACTYVGPNVLDTGEPMSVRFNNASYAPAYFMFYNIDGVELDRALKEPPQILLDEIPYHVDIGSGRAVPQRTERVMTWAFVDEPRQWVMACVDGLVPYGRNYFRVSEHSWVYQGAGLAPARLE